MRFIFELIKSITVAALMLGIVLNMFSSLADRSAGDFEGFVYHILISILDVLVLIMVLSTSKGD